MRRLWELLIQTGVLPALLMVALQYCLANHTGNEMAPTVAWVTFGGTMTIYSLDHFLESWSGLRVERRHHISRTFLLGVMAFFLVVLFKFMVPLLSSGFPTDFLILDTHQFDVLTWFSALSAGGLAYLAITSGRVRAFPALKEGLGACLFYILVCGLVDLEFRTSVAFILMGFSNFVWSGFTDRERDRFNHITSLANVHPKFATSLARGAALTALLLFLILELWFLGAVSLVLLAWPSRWKHVDWCFLPVLPWVMLTWT